MTDIDIRARLCSWGNIDSGLSHSCILALSQALRVETEARRIAANGVASWVTSLANGVISGLAWLTM